MTYVIIYSYLISLLKILFSKYVFTTERLSKFFQECNHRFELGNFFEHKIFFSLGTTYEIFYNLHLLNLIA